MTKTIMVKVTIKLWGEDSEHGDTDAEVVTVVREADSKHSAGPSELDQRERDLVGHALRNLADELEEEG